VRGVGPARIEQGFQPPGRSIDEERADSVGHSIFLSQGRGRQRARPTSHILGRLSVADVVNAARYAKFRDVTNTLGFCLGERLFLVEGV
jgi:hypothetical protein